MAFSESCGVTVTDGNSQQEVPPCAMLYSSAALYASPAPVVSTTGLAADRCAAEATHRRPVTLLLLSGAALNLPRRTATEPALDEPQQGKAFKLSLDWSREIRWINEQVIYTARIS
jgi:hypothetical protein